MHITEKCKSQCSQYQQRLQQLGDETTRALKIFGTAIKFWTAIKIMQFPRFRPSKEEKAIGCWRKFETDPVTGNLSWPHVRTRHPACLRLWKSASAPRRYRWLYASALESAWLLLKSHWKYVQLISFSCSHRKLIRRQLVSVAATVNWSGGN